nr:hypothetical protein GTC16762_33090 [Pigmentibacter ruber]
MAAWDSVENTHHIQNQIIKLINLKKDKDSNFSLNALAEAIDVSSSVFYRLLSNDETKKTKYISKMVLKKIANYFQNNGYNISLDDILGVKKIYTEDVSIIPKKTLKNIPVYSPSDSKEALFYTDTDIDIKYINDKIFGFKFDDFIKPIFNEGSIWFVNINKKPENDTICAIKYKDKISLKRILINGKRILLGSIDKESSQIEELNINYEILGEIIKVKLP